LKILMAGADVVMLCSVLLKNGLHIIGQIEKEMAEWLSSHDYQSVQELRGSMSQKNCADPAAFERAQYMKAIMSHK